MSLIDFKQEAHHQGCLHVAVTALDELNTSLYSAVFERLCSLPPIQLSGTVLFLRFIRAEGELPPWSGKGPRWDEFSAHKQIVGLLGVAQCTDVDDLTNARAAMRAAVERHKPGLRESRMVVYGPKKGLESCMEQGAGVCVLNCPVDQEAYVAGDVSASELEEIVKGLTQDICTKLNARISQLEKLVSQTSRAETLPLLKSPFESREVLTQEEDAIDTRPLSRNHMMARLEKHLGDLYLLTGQLQQASAHYRSSLPSLKSGKDWLWAGSVHEGLSVTAIITKECEEVLGQKAQGADVSGTSSIFKKYTHRVNPVSGISSFAARTSSTLDSRRKAPAERMASDPSGARQAKSVTARRTPSTRSTPGDISRNESDEGLVIKTLTPQPATPLQLPIVEEDSGLLDIGDETDGVMESIQYEVEGEGDVEGEGEERWVIDSRLLQKDFIAKQYSLALFTYKKGGDAGGVCQIEALLKFARYLAKQKKTVKAAETLQRILKIDSRLVTYQNKVDLYITMAEVYKSMNFKRKAAMFTHYAARTVITNSAMLHANIPDVRNQNLVFQANALLVNCLAGFKLSSNLEDLPKQTAAHIGWPQLQACVLKDFVFTSRELQKDIEAINHSCYLLQVLHHHLPREELRELTTMLVDIVQEAQDKAKVNPMFAASLKGQLTSPLPLVNFPKVHSFHPKPLVNHLRPYRMKGFTSPVALEGGDKKTAPLEGPFIYTPIGKKKKKESRPEVVWVEEEPGEIAVEIVNPLPYDLKVEKMTVLLEGVNTEMYPSTLVLPPGEPQSFVLACIPKEPGLLSILGYRTVVFGVNNECKVKIPGDPVVRVVPQLPQLRVKVLPSSGLDPSSELTSKGELTPSNGMKRKMSRVSIDRLELMDGESCQCDFLLDSCKQHIDVESLTVSLKDYNEDYCQFTFDQEHINSLLPITKSKCVSFTITIQAKIPPWFRVINDATSSFTRKAVGLFDSNSSSVSLGTPEGSLKSELFFSSNNSTPSSSPTPKRTRGAAYARLPFKVPTKRKSSDSAYSSFTQESMMSLESLDLHIPQKPGQSTSQGNSPTRYHNSLGRPVKPPKPGPNKRAFDDVEAALDGFIFSMDSKRASVRSDPGDREESKLSRFGFKKDTSSFHSDTKPVSIPKSETTAARLSDLSNGASPMFFGAGVGGGGGGVAGHHQALASGVLFGAEAKTQSLARGLKGSNNKGKWQPSSSSTNTRYISNPIGPLYKENLRPPSKVKVVGEFSLEYSGGNGLREGFCRECRANVQIVVKPVLTFEQFDVSLVEGSPNLFELSFTLTNISKTKLHITCKVNQDGLVECGGLPEHTRTLDPNSSHKMHIPIKRFVVHNQPGAVRNESHIAKLYSEKLSEIIQFVWQETNKRKRGVIGLEGIRLATSCVSLMRPVPLRFEVTMNGRSFVPKGQSSIVQNLKVGEPFKVSLTLINNSGFLMPPSYLVLEPYQFSEELKRIVKDLRGKMIATCSFVNKVQELNPGRFYVHEVTLVFLEKGVFQLDIKSMTPSNSQQQLRASTGSSLEAHSRTGSVSETSLSRSPIKKASKKSGKNRPSQQNKDKPSSTNGGSKGESLPSIVGVNRGGKEKAVAQQSPKNSPASPGSMKKTKGPLASVGAKRPASTRDETNCNRTNFIDGELSGVLPSVARMVSMIEGKGTVPPPVPTSTRPKLKGVAAGSSVSPHPDQSTTAVAATTNSDSSSNSSSGDRVEKRPHPIVTGSTALAKPVPLASVNPASSKPTDPDCSGKQEDGQEGSKAVGDSPTELKRLVPQRIESVILLSSHSRSQNLWNARLQNSNSVKLLSGPHFTFNVT